MTTDAFSLSPTDDCARFDAQLGLWLERDLESDADTWMAQHRARCAGCDTIVRELDALVTEAAALPPLAPPRDLWPAIEARLEAPVIPITTGGRVSAPTASARTITLRRFAIAATLLVAVSSGVTWQLARRDQPTAGATRVASAPTAVPAADPPATDDAMAGATTELAIGTPTSAGTRASMARLVSDDDVPNAGVTFEREIVALRHIVDARFSELDTVTVQELRRNLDIIDRAIADSRAALARDPRSGLLSWQLDRALQAKLELLRRVALL
jgi:hypothetical protein